LFYFFLLKADESFWIAHCYFFCINFSLQDFLFQHYNWWFAELFVDEIHTV
jgi:hypothetical protein